MIGYKSQGDYTVEEQIANAVYWIDKLPEGKQAPIDFRGYLGNETKGFCCLGFGCHVLNVPYDYGAGISHKFQQAVGLITQSGSFTEGAEPFYKEYALSVINDHTNAGFKRISQLMRKHPEYMFTTAVAAGIRKHYESN